MTRNNQMPLEKIASELSGFVDDPTSYDEFFGDEFSTVSTGCRIFVLERAIRELHTTQALLWSKKANPVNTKMFLIWVMAQMNSEDRIKK